MTDEFKFHIGDKAVDKILELKDQEPGDKEYALFLQIDGAHENQFTYDLSFLDVEFQDQECQVYLYRFF